MWRVLLTTTDDVLAATKAFSLAPVFDHVNPWCKVIIHPSALFVVFLARPSHLFVAAFACSGGGSATSCT